MTFRWFSISVFAPALVVVAGVACSSHGTVGMEDSGRTDANGDGAAMMDGSDANRADGDGGLDVLGDVLADVPMSHHVVTCSGCACFPGTDCTGSGDAGAMPPSCTGAGTTPSLVYPPEGVLLPPNTNVIEVQFMPGTGNTLFEIDFENAVTDVRIETMCNPITNSRGIATGGCGFTLDMTNWTYVAAVNAGGLPVAVTIRATPDGSCVGTSNTRHISFSSQDLNGGIYYWQSATVGGVPGTVGGIFRYDFGREDIAPEAFLESSSTAMNRCIGCHFVSRDGLAISYGSDDDDSDDEYSDVQSSLMAVPTRVLITSMITPGFRTFTHDHTTMLASDGRPMLMSPAFNEYSGTTGVLTGRGTTGGMRGTQPDWSADDSHVVYVRPAEFLLPPMGPMGMTGMSTTTGDDNHFIGGSLEVAVWTGSVLAGPTTLLASTGENNYYPAYSPDGAFVVFNRVMGSTGLAADCYSNPNARVWVMPSGGGAPVDLANLNMGDGLSNSWPRWSPYVQSYNGHNLVWVTFSSTRDYGLRVHNQDPAAQFCYPPETPENQNGSHMCPLIPTSCNCMTTGCAGFCVQPQLWMAAVEVDASGGISAGVDTSFPAFWLPFQDDTAHNHIAEWVESIPGEPPPPDAGAADAAPLPDATSADSGPPPCTGGGGTCGPGLPLCCAAYACVGGSCGVP